MTLGQAEWRRGGELGVEEEDGVRQQAHSQRINNKDFEKGQRDLL